MNAADEAKLKLLMRKRSWTASRYCWLENWTILQFFKQYLEVVKQVAMKPMMNDKSMKTKCFKIPTGAVNDPHY